MKKITVRKVDWKIFIINLITVIVPVYFIVVYAAAIQNTTLQTVMIIATLSIVGGINFIIVKKGTHIISIILKNDEIEFTGENKVIYSSKFSAVENYNIYRFVNKRAGYIIRLRSQTGSFCSLFTWKEFNKAAREDQQNYETVRQVLQNKMPGKKKITGLDYLLRMFSAMPYLFLGIAVLLLVGIFIYIAFYI